jgi:hypothetical protein
VTYDAYILVPGELLLADRPASFILDLQSARRALVEQSRQRRATIKKARVPKPTKAPRAGRRTRGPKRSIAELVCDNAMFKKLFPEEETSGNAERDAGRSGQDT